MKDMGGGQPRGYLALGQSGSPDPILSPRSRSGLPNLDLSTRSPDSPPRPVSHLLRASTGVISNWTDEHRLPPCTIFQAFKYYLDITTPPTPLQLQQFASLATSEKEKQRLLVLSKVGPWPHTYNLTSSSLENCIVIATVVQQMAVLSEGCHSLVCRSPHWLVHFG